MQLTLSMNFSNSLIAPEQLPSIEEVSFQSLEKDFLVVERMSLLFSMGILSAIGIALIYFIDNLQNPVIISVAVTVLALMGIFRLLAINISYKYSGYALREKDLLFRTGWLTRKTRIVMLNRIQHVSVQSGPLERRFGLSSVSVFTAGSSAADFTITGITEDTAQKIKAWISFEAKGDGEQ